MKTALLGLHNFQQHVLLAAFGPASGSDPRCNDSPDEAFDVVVVIASVFVYFGLPYILQQMSPSLSLPAGGETRCWPRSLPALASLRYIAVLMIWFNHSQLWISPTSELFLMLSGFLLQFAEHRRVKTNEKLCDMYLRFVPRRIWKLYPLFALHVFIGYLSDRGQVGSFKHFPEETKCDPVPALLMYQSWGFGTGACQQTAAGDWHKFYHSCGYGTWFISVIFGCYILFPPVSILLQGLQRRSGVVLWMVCASTLVVLPRALSFEVSPDVVDLHFTRRSIPFGFASFFLGMTTVIIWESSQDWNGLSERETVTDVETNGEQREREREAATEDSGRAGGQSMLSVLSLSYGCSLGMLLMCIRKGIDIKVGFGSSGGSYSHDTDHLVMKVLSASALEILEVVGQTLFIIGAAGPVKTQERSKAGSSSPARHDLLHQILSWAPLAGMSGLALPLYMLSNAGVLFADRFLYQTFNQYGVPPKDDQGSFWPLYFVAELICIHVVAIMVNRSCRTAD